MLVFKSGRKKKCGGSERRHAKTEINCIRKWVRIGKDQIKYKDRTKTQKVACGGRAIRITGAEGRVPSNIQRTKTAKSPGCVKSKNSEKKNTFFREQVGSLLKGREVNR